MAWGEGEGESLWVPAGEYFLSSLVTASWYFAEPHERDLRIRVVPSYLQRQPECKRTVTATSQNTEQISLMSSVAASSVVRELHCHTPEPQPPSSLGLPWASDMNPGLGLLGHWT